MISIIAAVSKNGVIGVDNKLPWVEIDREDHEGFSFLTYKFKDK
jgi:dihydrofolate reductase